MSIEISTRLVSPYMSAVITIDNVTHDLGLHSQPEIISLRDQLRDALDNVEYYIEEPEARMNNRRESIEPRHIQKIAEDIIYCSAIFVLWLGIAAFADLLLTARSI